MTFLIIKSSFSEEQFVNAVFQLIVSELENFEMKHIPKLTELVSNLTVSQNTEYAIFFNNQKFEFKVFFSYD